MQLLELAQQVPRPVRVMGWREEAVRPVCAHGRRWAAACAERHCQGTSLPGRSREQRGREGEAAQQTCHKDLAKGWCGGMSAMLNNG